MLGDLHLLKKCQITLQVEDPPNQCNMFRVPRGYLSSQWRGSKL